MSLLDRGLAALLWLLGVLCVAGITHIVAIFALPETSEKDPYARLAGQAKPAELILLDAAGPERQPVPFADPALAQAICPFDLSQGGLRLHANTEGGRLLGLSFRTHTGRVFYSMSDLAAQQGKMDVLVLTPAQLEIVESEDDEESPSQDLRLIAPGAKGFVVISALAAFPSERLQTVERLKSISCTLEQIPQD
jgi:uncharacterized membrane protein